MKIFSKVHPILAVPSMVQTVHERSMDTKLDRDLRTLVMFIDIYCRGRHQHMEKSPVSLQTHDLKAIAGRTLALCPSCSKLLAHALVKRTLCPLDPKETWALITWLIYGIYLHCRLLKSSTPTKLAWLSIAGFAAVIFTYIGVSYLLTGLHSYA